MAVATSVTIVEGWPVLFSQLSSVRSKKLNYDNGNVVIIALLVMLFSLTPMQSFCQKVHAPLLMSVNFV